VDAAAQFQNAAQDRACVHVSSGEGSKMPGCREHFQPTLERGKAMRFFRQLRRKQRARNKSRRNSRGLRFEGLEGRTLMAAFCESPIPDGDQTNPIDGLAGSEFVGAPQSGSIIGRLWHDHNGDGHMNDGESPLPGRTVFVDVNANLKPDGGEPYAVTDATGRYKIKGLGPGEQMVCQDLPDGWQQTMPERAFLRDTMYGIDDSTGDLYRINPQTADVTVIGSVGLSHFNSLAYDSDWTLYGLRSWWDWGSGLYHTELHTINPHTQTATLIGSQRSVRPGLRSLAISPEGDAYAIGGKGGPQGESLYKINLNTGFSTLIAPLDGEYEWEDEWNETVRSMEWREHNGEGQLVGFNQHGNSLTLIDPETGTYSELAEFAWGGMQSGMTVVGEQAYFSNDDDLWVMELDSGAHSKIDEFSPSYNDISGLAWRPGHMGSFVVVDLALGQSVQDVNFASQRSTEAPARLAADLVYSDLGDSSKKDGDDVLQPDIPKLLLYDR
jgi:hypothetical protein